MVLIAIGIIVVVAVVFLVLTDENDLSENFPGLEGFEDLLGGGKQCPSYDKLQVSYYVRAYKEWGPKPQFRYEGWEWVDKNEESNIGALWFYHADYALEIEIEYMGNVWNQPYYLGEADIGIGGEQAEWKIDIVLPINSQQDVNCTNVWSYIPGETVYIDATLHVTPVEGDAYWDEPYEKTISNAIVLTV